MENLNISLLQMDLVWEDRAANFSKAEAMIRAIGPETDLVILPEMFTTGFHMEPENNAEPAHGPAASWMQQMAAEVGAVLTGSVIVKENGNFYNRLYVVDQQGVIMTYNKRHLFRMAGEDKSYAPGEDSPVFNLKGWRIRPLICYDLRFPVWSRNRLQSGGEGAYDLLLYVANWPERRVSHWKALLAARAIENQAYVAGVNRVGVDGNEIVYSGDSGVYDPLGKAVVTATGQENTLNASLDASLLKDYREKFPAWKDADQFRIGD